MQSGKVYLQRCNSQITSASPSERKHQTNKTVPKLQDLNFPLAPKQPLCFFDDTSLDLKLVQSSSSPPSSKYQSVCTLDKVKSALERAEKETIRKRSISMSQSSSPSNSSSSIKETDHVEEKSSPSFAAGCPSCLLYVLISKSNPKCPGCNMIVPSPMPLKKPRIDLNISIWVVKITVLAVSRLILIFVYDRKYFCNGQNNDIWIYFKALVFLLLLRISNINFHCFSLSNLLCFFSSFLFCIKLKVNILL